MMDITNIAISVIDAEHPLYTDVWHLREEVLRKPLGLSLANEDLSMDRQDKIVVLQVNGEVAGCIMLHPVDAHTVKFRQMAVYEQWQHKGFGKMLVDVAENEARKAGHKLVVLHARMVAHLFYLKCGYAEEGEIFTEVNIPHKLMKKHL